MLNVDYSKKIALLGDPSVGKTSIQDQYLGLGFSANYKPTLGANFSTKDYKSSKGTVRVSILDMSGHQGFKNIRNLLLKGVSGVFIVFDVTRPFNAELQIIPWIKETLENTIEKQIPLAILGNKTDLEFIRQFPSQLYKEEDIVNSDGMKSNSVVRFFETSAKENRGIDEAFDWLISEIISLTD